MYFWLFTWHWQRIGVQRICFSFRYSCRVEMYPFTSPCRRESFKQLQLLINVFSWVVSHVDWMWGPYFREACICTLRGRACDGYGRDTKSRRLEDIQAQFMGHPWASLDQGTSQRYKLFCFRINWKPVRMLDWIWLLSQASDLIARWIESDMGRGITTALFKSVMIVQLKGAYSLQF